jgi:hypothetical protein
MADSDTTSAHWDAVWQRRPADEVTWHQPNPAVSLQLITRVTDPDAAVIDIGGGASLLVDELIGLGYSDLTVLDVAAPAISSAKKRLGARAESVDWIVDDVTRWNCEREFDLWHDRAVLHFFTEEADRDHYLERLRRGVAAGGHVVLATFGLQGPEQCSGLPVRRYGPDTMIETLGSAFEPLDFVEELHETPTGATQQFQYGLFRNS